MSAADNDSGPVTHSWVMPEGDTEYPRGGGPRYVVLRRSDVDALMEEWGDLDCDPFWRPVGYVMKCRNQGMGLVERPCGFCHEGACEMVLEVGQ